MISKIEPGNGAVLAAIIAAGVSLASAVINVVIVMNQSKKQRIAQIITNNRVEWMQKLKDYISEYISIVEYYYDKPVPSDLEAYLNQLYCITAKIKLHLNFKGKQDKELIKYIEALNKSFENFFQLERHKNVFGNNNQKKKEDFQKIIDFYLYNYPEEIGNYVGKNIVKNANIDVSNKEECKKFYMNLMETKEGYYSKVYDEVIKYINRDLNGCINKIKVLCKLILLLSQVYLKTEWERVKVESKDGKANKFKFDDEYEKIKESVQAEIDVCEKDISC